MSGLNEVISGLTATRLERMGNPSRTWFGHFRELVLRCEIRNVESAFKASNPGFNDFKHSRVNQRKYIKSVLFLIMTEFTAEFTTNHMGNFNVLMRMVEQAVDAGADYIKMQKKDVENFYTEEKLNSNYKSPYGHTYREYRKIFEFDRTDFDRFDEKCEDLDIEWFATPQDIKSLHFVLEYNMPYVKVASTNSRNDEMLTELRDKVPKNTGLVISIGGSTMNEVKDTLSHFPDHNIILQHCVSEYPVPPENLGLGNIPVLEEKFGSDRVSIGYSGHETGIGASLAAIDMGAELVERHFCLSRRSFVHHIEPSLEPDEFDELTTIVEEKDDYESYYEDLPDEAFETNFGMTELEKKFLEENTYSNEFLGEKSDYN